ncbi:MAG: hypothetical protein EAY75_08670 [Bacteroidetes bacterium]|nr:MAG: hypothetical protein EAY75_08670 [Bacteroidota bacterium]
MAEQSIHKQIEAWIKKRGRGSILFPQDFYSIGSTEAVKKILLRLEKKGMLTRLAFGIYLYPKQSKLLGNITPSLEEIAKAIAKRDKARIVPTGSYALNALGLSTQVPLNAVYLTDGAARRVKIGKRTILFKKSSPKNLAAVGPISGLAIQALKAIGEGRVSTEEEQKLLQLLKKENQEALKQDIALAPEWIKVIMKKLMTSAQ